MPIKVTAYSCQFKCGWRVQTKRYRMVAHEKICFHNPERRACQTCNHHVFDGDIGLYCDIETEETEIVLTWGCFAWTPREPDPDATSENKP